MALGVISQILHPYKDLRVLKLNEPLAGALLVSPWVNFGEDTESFRLNTDKDIVTPPLLREMVKVFVADSDRNNWSEPYLTEEGWFKNFPAKSVLNLSGEHELLRDSIDELGTKMLKAGVNVENVECPLHVHVDCILDAQAGLDYGEMATKSWDWLAKVFSNVAFVTGAGSGIGQACTLELVRAGVTGLLITDINEKSLAQTVRLSKAINENLPILAEVADITLDDTATRLVSQAAEKFGRLDYALNVAGVVGKQGPIDQLDPAAYDFVASVNARAVWLCERAEIAQMLKQDRGKTHDDRTGDRGAIVNIASICGIVGFPYSTPYTMAKHAVLGLTRSDSTTFAAQGIRVNGLCPGSVFLTTLLYTTGR
ncbi:uncharacterized protein A1O9_06918 [Exophiala aquamarina CBS 119918]|uniref:Alpha/beta hydrolase fold-3 domain-containing protein n=1 Tax=Exophiala aquamarina CBS 119918 TaxID=1182545 RepID=A0A072PBT5_9EURO|nr:uncharacterized protein A1O9_06918 [Exophiala aquamarina CBS 119918]KEF56728.1 hypothetical protein A1O9_06918 [Exophiala aquamarina CBS 119918]